MKDRFNKPRVFLSHSKKDAVFIRRLEVDLRKCQIDPWLDEYEIRHGEPWLAAIFENGLPTCDAVLVYLSNDSIASQMVQKEVDAGIIRKLQDSQIAFLPYVTESALRTRLRIDLQALQTLEWNDANYNELLPKVVAEIWRSYLASVVVQATQREKVGRLEAELRVRELENQQEAGGFSASETQDFEYIWAKVDRYEPVVFIHKEGMGESEAELGRYTVGVHVGSLLPELSGSSSYEFDKHDILNLAYSKRSQALSAIIELPSNAPIEIDTWPDIGDELLRYGFLSRFHKPVPPTGTSIRYMLVRTSGFGLMFTEKLERFKYWLAQNDRLAEGLLWK